MIQPHSKAIIGGETFVQVERWIANYVDWEAICRAGGRMASLIDAHSYWKGASLSCLGWCKSELFQHCVELNIGRQGRDNSDITWVTFQIWEIRQYVTPCVQHEEIWLVFEGGRESWRIVNNYYLETVIGHDNIIFIIDLEAYSKRAGLCSRIAG